MALTIRPLDLERDAEQLAAMWNASDQQWPLSWTHGVPLDEEIIRLREEEYRTLVTLVAELEGKVVGYCSFAEMEEGGRGYLLLLNVHPSYQGRSIGRRLIQETIARSVEKGWKRQTLDTWPANFKAVPTYKKTGHFWVPGTCAVMENFIPGTLQMPLAKPFFARHDWYACYVRELAQSEDEEQWEGIPVFTQRWRAGEEELTVWIDRNACAPMAIETNELQVAAIIENPEPLVGTVARLRWRVVNKTPRPLNVSLHATGGAGLEIDRRETFQVPPQQTWECQGQVRISEAVDAQGNEPAPAVRSLFLIDGAEVELFSGVWAKRPIRIDVFPAKISLYPKVPSQITLQLSSELDHSEDFFLTLTPPPGVELPWRMERVRLDAHGHLSIPIELTCAREGVYELPVRLEAAEEGKALVASQTFPIFALGPGGVLAHRTESGVRLENDLLRLFIEAKGGSLSLERKKEGRRVTQIAPSWGPPFFPSVFAQTRFALQVTEQESRVLVRLKGKAREPAGLALMAELSFSASGFVELNYYLENQGAHPLEGRFRLRLRDPQEALESIWPLEGGFIRFHAGEYPTNWRDALREASSFDEPWMSWDFADETLAVSWGRTTTKILSFWGTQLESIPLVLPPGGRSPCLSFAFYMGARGWQRAREVLLGWAGRHPTASPVLQKPIHAQLCPQVLLTLAPDVRAELRVVSASAVHLDGQIQLELENGSVEPSNIKVQDLYEGRDLVRPASFHLPKELGVYRGKARYLFPHWEGESEFAIVRLGDESLVQISQETLEEAPVWFVDNGTSCFVIAPSFGPSVVSWDWQGMEVLWSVFPIPQGMAWEYPWFGGIHPFLMRPDSKCRVYLSAQDVSVVPVKVSDEQSILWQGVRLRMRPPRDVYPGLAFEVDFLTVGGANLLKWVYRLRNLRRTGCTVRVGGTVAGRLGGDPLKVSLHAERISRYPTPWGTTIWRNPWGALVQEENGRALLLVSDREDVVLSDNGVHGRVLNIEEELYLEGNQQKEFTYYLISAPGLSQARAYLALSKLSSKRV